MEAITKEEAKGGHPVNTEAPKAKEYEWVDKATGEIHKIPEGIDPGWDYNPGKEGFKDN